jgi:NAD(P)-dependent dehydrogenase (short-subunit alcohol dehydrogenase family)
MNSVLLTGGSGGIGSAIVKELRESKIYNLDIQMSRELFPNEIFLKTDLRLENDILQSISQIPKDDLNTVIFCAGYGGPFIPLEKVNTELWNQIFQINLNSSYIILREFIELLKIKKKSQIVFIASSQSLVGAKYSVAYSSSKHAVLGMVKSLADELGEYGISVNAISPGYIQTNMGVQEGEVPNHYAEIISKTPSKKIGKPVDVAKIVKFLVSQESGYINGANWTVDGGITSI